jgi:hypothetical protein
MLTTMQVDLGDDTVDRHIQPRMSGTHG